MNNKRYGLKAETMLRDILVGRGYFCIRSAASKVVDLVVTGPVGPWIYVIEVKRTSGSILRVSRTANQKEQYEALKALGDRYYALEPIYAVMFGDGVTKIYGAGKLVMRECEGWDFDCYFPDLHITPNIPPIVPRKPAGYAPGCLPESQTTEAAAEYARQGGGTE